MATKRKKLKRPSRTVEDQEVQVTKKVAHNMVECRRKQRISQSINVLSNLVDSCNCGKETRAEVLQKAVDKIQDLEKSNSELKKTIDGNNLEQSETSLQMKLALAVVDHFNLLLSILSHKDVQTTTEQQHDHSRSNSTNTCSNNTNKTIAVQQQPVKHKTRASSNQATERLSRFAMENLLEASSPYERTAQGQYFPQDGECSVSVTTRHIPEMCCTSVTSQLEPLPSWYPSISADQGYYLPPAYPTTTPLDSETVWPHPTPPTQLCHPLHHCHQQRFDGTAGDPYLSRGNGVPPAPVSQPVWRPYNDLRSSSHAPFLPPLHSPPHQASYSQQQSTSFLVGQLLENIQ